MGISPSVERQRERSSPFQRTMETPDNHQMPCKNQDFKETSAIHSFSSLELKLLHTAVIGWNGSRDDKKWRIKAIPRMIKAGMDRTAVLEQQLGIFVDEHPSRPGCKSSPHVKGVIVDGVISHDDNVVKKAIKDFWESLLSIEDHITRILSTN